MFFDPKPQNYILNFQKNRWSCDKSEIEFGLMVIEKFNIFRFCKLRIFYNLLRLIKMISKKF